MAQKSFIDTPHVITIKTEMFYKGVYNSDKRLYNSDKRLYNSNK